MLNCINMFTLLTMLFDFHCMIVFQTKIITEGFQQSGGILLPLLSQCRKSKKSVMRQPGVTGKRSFHLFGPNLLPIQNSKSTETTLYNVTTVIIIECVENNG